MKFRSMTLAVAGKLQSMAYIERALAAVLALLSKE
jgi:hypothetical protein